MSTSTKKVSKKESKESDHSDIEQSDMENDIHSIFNGDFKKNPKEAEYFLKHFNAIKNQFYDDESADKISKYIWGESLDSLVELIKKNNKREKTKKSKFTPISLEKPKKPIDIFGKTFSEESKKNGVKFGKDNNYLVCRKTAWDNLSDKQREKYIKQSKKEQETYDIEYAKLKSEAIMNGEFPEDKIKGPLTAYFLFLADVRSKLTEQFKDESNKNTKITKEGGRLWKELPEEEKEKYTEKYKEAKAVYDIKKQEWNNNEIQRVKKQDNLPDDVKVESSGSKKVEKKKTPEETETNEGDSEAEEQVEVEVKTKKARAKPTTKTTKTTKKTPSKTDSDDDVEVEDEVEEPPPEKAKAKAKAKSSKAK